MAGTELGYGYIGIYARMAKSFNSEAANAAKSFGSTFNSHLSKWTVAAGQVIAQGLTTAIHGLGQTFKEAVTYSDAMTRFPLVLESLGKSAADADIAVEILKDGLKGTPTILSDATTSVQRMVATTGDVKKSAQAFVALNDALAAGGGNAEIQAAAQEQFIQALSKGKPDRIEFRSWLTAMPSVMEQMAKSFGMTTEEMHDAFSKGKIDMNQFVDNLIKLDKEGIEGFANLHDQARKAMIGIDRGLAMIKKSVVENMGEFIKSLNISGQMGAFEDIGNGIATTLTNILRPLGEAVSEDIAKGLSSLGNVLNKTGDAASYFGEMMAKAYSKVKEFVKVELAPEIKKLLDILKDGGWESFLNLIKPVATFIMQISKTVVTLVAVVAEFLRENKELTGAIGWFLEKIAPAAAFILVFGVAIGKAAKFVMFFNSAIKGFKGGQIAKELGQAGNPAKALAQSFGQFAGKAVMIAAVGFALIGLGVAFKLIAEGASQLASTEGALLGLVAIGAVIGGFLAVFILFREQLTQAIPAMIAFGIAIVLVSGGMLLLALAASMIAASGGLAIAALAMFAVIIGVLVIGIIALSAVGPIAIAVMFALSVAAIALGVAFLLMSVGITLIINAIANLVGQMTGFATVLPIIAEYGLQAGVNMLILAAGILAVGVAALIGGVGLAVLSAMALIAIAPLTVLMGIFFGLSGALALCALALGGMADNVQKMADAGGEACSKLWELNDACDVVGAALDGVKNAVQGVFDFASGIFKGLASAGQQSMSEMWEQMVQGSYSGKDRVISALNDMVSGVNAILSSAGDGAWWAGHHVGEMYAEGIRSCENQVRNAAQALVNAAQERLGSAINVNVKANPQPAQLVGNVPSNNLLGNGLSNDIESTIPTGYTPESNTGTRVDNLTQAIVYNVYINNARVNDNPVIRKNVYNVLQEVNRKRSLNANSNFVYQ